MSDQASIDIPVQSDLGDYFAVAAAVQRLAGATGALAVAEQKHRNGRHRNGRGRVAADQSLAASQDVIEARIALSHLLTRRGSSPHPGHRAVDEIIAAEAVGFLGG
jgi:hypothetical protein